MPPTTRQSVVDAVSKKACGISIGDRAGYRVRELVEPVTDLADDLGKAVPSFRPVGVDADHEALRILEQKQLPLGIELAVRRDPLVAH